MAYNTIRPFSLAAILALALAFCSDLDILCHANEARRLTNQVRQRHGKNSLLQAGTMSMLENAVDHSKFMGNTRTFEHQNLNKVTADIQCGLFCS